MKPDINKILLNFEESEKKREEDEKSKKEKEDSEKKEAQMAEEKAKDEREKEEENKFSERFGKKFEEATKGLDDRISKVETDCGKMLEMMEKYTKK